MILFLSYFFVFWSGVPFPLVALGEIKDIIISLIGKKHFCQKLLNFCRYGVVEGDPAKSKLFTISNPVVGTKNPAIVAKWCGSTYAQEKSQQLAGSLGSLAVSDDGRYLATGTMGGSIYILIAFSLQVNISNIVFSLFSKFSVYFLLSYLPLSNKYVT